MPHPKVEIIQSEDGSNTLFLPEMNETYHSTHGAIQESNHVFIHHGLIPKLEQQNEITLLEVGFGTGLNVLLSANLLFEKYKTNKLFYTTTEPFPLSESILSALNYGQILNLSQLFKEIHQSPWEVQNNLGEGFYLIKNQNEIQKLELKDNSIDLIYFDAFAPQKQTEMWDVNLFDKLFKALKVGGVLVSYCAQGQFKRNLKTVGFDVESLPGPPGKKEMTRAVKNF